MNAIILIPARLASTRLPNKPLALIGDAPMIVQVWRRAVAAGIGKVVVACDSDAIAQAITQAGGDAVLTEPDLPSGSDRIYQALQQIDPEQRYDRIINVQGDMPTLEPRLIAQVAALLDDPQADIATLCAQITDEAEKIDPAVVKVVVSGDWALGIREQQLSNPQSLMPNALYFSRQPIPYGDGPFYHHIGIYAYRRAALTRFVQLPPSPLEQREKLEQLRALEAGMRIAIRVVDTVPLGVDTEETLAKARKYYEQH